MGRTWSLRLLLLIPVFFLVVVLAIPNSLPDNELEADPGALKIAPVPEDPIIESRTRRDVDAAHASDSPHDPVTTTEPSTVTPDYEDLEDTTPEVDTKGPEERIDVVDDSESSSPAVEASSASEPVVNTSVSPASDTSSDASSPASEPDRDVSENEIPEDVKPEGAEVPVEPVLKEPESSPTSAEPKPEEEANNAIISEPLLVDQAIVPRTGLEEVEVVEVPSSESSSPVSADPSSPSGSEELSSTSDPASVSAGESSPEPTPEIVAESPESSSPSSLPASSTSDGEEVASSSQLSPVSDVSSSQSSSDDATPSSPLPESSSSASSTDSPASSSPDDSVSSSSPESSSTAELSSNESMSTSESPPTPEFNSTSESNSTSETPSTSESVSTSANDTDSSSEPTAESSSESQPSLNCTAKEQDNVTSVSGEQPKSCNSTNTTTDCEGDTCCKSSKFGCCRDDKTPALGPDYEGCGCETSEHGCCPDQKTPARGANQTGCPCDSQPHGCCPDHLTPAHGPEHEGCPCSTMPFGCCPNSSESATGPLFAGCSCAQTPYGCCPNGQSVAIGPKFEGCPDGTPLDTRLSAQACSLPRERGPCRNYSVKWTYDMEYGGCIRFWYGGCEGNANRFQSQEECERVCVNPEGSEACLLPKVTGPCEGKYSAFFFNSETRTCESFVYGGCLGNKNRFDTMEDCAQLCLSTPSKDPCEQPVIQGPCRGFHPRWYYSKPDGRCRRFVYGGCQKNDNNFESEAACRAKCGSASPQQLCLLPKAEGPCLGSYPRWFYDYLDQSCKEFTYTGCEGNRNRFVDKSSCERTCNQTQVVDLHTDICSLPKDSGPCVGTMLRWHFNSAARRCEQFYYGGCQGNANKFESRTACERACTPATRERQDVCHLPLDAGVAEGNCVIRPYYNLEERWFYNQSDQVCHRFYFTGCGGNGNNFKGLDECQDRCGRPSAPPPPPTVVPEFKSEFCRQPRERGHCSANEIVWWYDHRDGVCKEFYYSGCGGNMNRFSSRKECEMKCWNSQDVCRLKKVPGPCTASFVQWYYDPASDQCLSFSYSGCSGNANRFSQKESCETQCKINQASSAVIPFLTPGGNGNSVIDSNGIPDSSPAVVMERPPDRQVDPICLQPQESGRCSSYLPRYRYDVNENICRSFVYTGCGGNDNRFETRPECEARCVASRGEDEPLTPAERGVVCRMAMDGGSCQETHARWAYDANATTCMPFVYTGCGGNKNRFKAFSTCVKFCTGVRSETPVSIDEHEDAVSDGVEKTEDRIVGSPDTYPVFSPPPPSTTTTVSSTTQRDLCRFECADEPNFTGCEDVVQMQFCTNPDYGKLCCRSCFLNNLLSIDKVKELVIGSDRENYHVLNDGNRICFFESNRV